MKKINWRYTLGEILIVIIGITIAFSMNKCAENNKNHILKEKYLENLKNDIEIDKKNLEDNLVKLKTKDSILIGSFKYFDPNFPNRDSILIANFFGTAQIIDFSTKNSTYQTLINSGDLNLIDNFDLRTNIEEHYRTYEIMRQDYDRIENISKEYIADYFIFNIDMDKYRNGEKAFSDEKLLKSIMGSTYGAIRLKIRSTQKSVESCDAILKKINSIHQ